MKLNSETILLPPKHLRPDTAAWFTTIMKESRVCLLHEEAVSIPTNLSGVVYVPFPEGNVAASFGVLNRELKAMYRQKNAL